MEFNEVNYNVGASRASLSCKSNDILHSQLLARYINRVSRMRDVGTRAEA